MPNYHLLCRIKLSGKNEPSGKTRNFVNGVIAPVPNELKIIQYPDSQGFYLFYCDESGKEFNDTFHDSVSEAKTQAEWEFGIKPEEWENF